MPSTRRGHIVRFGSFELDVSAGELRNRGLRLPVQGQPILVLALLLENTGEVVTREELRNRIWPADTFVDFDHALNNSIASLREVLGDSAAKPRYIETLRRRGYRWIGPVDTNAVRSRAGTPDSESPDGATNRPPAAPVRREHWGARVPVLAVAALVLIVCATLVIVLARAPRGFGAGQPIRSIAVLPLENLSGDPSQEYFADGLTDELITNLAKLSSLRVISRTSVMQYKNARKPVSEIGRELNVDALVQGAVVRSTEKVRISAQLIHAADDRHVWADSYERHVDDIVLLQNEIARAIAEQVRGTLTPQEKGRLTASRAVDPAAYEAYLQGRFLWNKRTRSALTKAVERFQYAIAKDPAYPRAYAGLADAYLVLGSWSLDALPPTEAFPKAKAAVEKALELDSTSAEAHTALAAIKHIYEWDWEGAGIEFRRAIELSPSYGTAHQWYGQYLTELGRYDEGIAETAQSFSTDPLYRIGSATVAHRYYWARRYDEANARLQQMLDLAPEAPAAHRLSGQVYEQKGMYEEAIAAFQRAANLSGNEPNAVAALGHGYAISGQRREALDIIKQLKEVARQRYVSSFQLALVYAGMGERDQALEWLERAYQERSTWMVHLKVDPRLDPLRPDPRFRDLMVRVGLTP